MCAHACVHAMLIYQYPVSRQFKILSSGLYTTPCISPETLLFRRGRRGGERGRGEKGGERGRGKRKGGERGRGEEEVQEDSRFS